MKHEKQMARTKSDPFLSPVLPPSSYLLVIERRWLVAPCAKSTPSGVAHRSEYLYPLIILSSLHLITSYLSPSLSYTVSLLLRSLRHCSPPHFTFSKHITNPHEKVSSILPKSSKFVSRKRSSRPISSARPNQVSVRRPSLSSRPSNKSSP